MNRLADSIYKLGKRVLCCGVAFGCLVIATSEDTGLQLKVITLASGLTVIEYINKWGDEDV